ncbi:lipocalin-like domain-containing protein [Fibrella aquatilis]|uniref:Lipocalin family protein n=1 Tax=Fibrella aquatilis TaxID=2817059 RepID=A0A939G6Q3_9BACT|nr:lipocalin family protein [Fibrella aquatilis]MBO0931056.1 lipocalin family protein [Fibrella aquatilis]
MKTLLLSLCLFITLSGMAQSVVGTWKRVGAIVTNKDGSMMDMLAMTEKMMPCTNNITYTFLASGIQQTSIPADCQKRLGVMANQFMGDARYKLKGNQLIITPSASTKLPAVTYTVTLSGNTMMWVMDADAQPGKPNKSNVKSILMSYQKQ